MPTSRKLEDEIRISLPPIDDLVPSTNDVLIYYVAGNPGLIEYYRHFLTSISQNLPTSKDSTRYHLIGRSLGGYELNGFPDEKSLPLSLQDQVGFVEQSLEHYVTSILATSKGTKRPLPVILVGHSVGTYIILELIARRQKWQKQRQPLSSSSRDYELISAIHLFPTIIDIANGPSGKKVSPFATSTYLAPTLHAFSWLLTTLTPRFALKALVERVTGHPPDGATVTAAFLASRKGVLQALYMGRCELLDMTHDKWSEEVWRCCDRTEKDGAGEVEVDRPQMYFYWGENDHWIDNATRDGVIAKRARAGDGLEQVGKPWMEVDTRGTPHDFCIREESSELVAEKVAGYIKQVMEELSKRGN